MSKTLVERRVDQARKNNIIEKWMFRIGLFIIILAALVSFLFFKEIFFPAKVLDLKSLNLSVNPTEVIAGEKVAFVVNYCKHKNTPSDIKVTFVDSQLIGSFNTTRNFPTGCHKQPVSVDVPLSLKKDSYHLEVQISYSGGFINNEVHFLRTKSFNVSEPKTDPRLMVIQQCIAGNLPGVFDLSDGTTFKPVVPQDQPSTDNKPSTESPPTQPSPETPPQQPPSLIQQVANDAENLLDFVNPFN